MTVSHVVKVFLFAALATGGTSRAWSFGLLDRLFHPERYQQTAYAPVVPDYAAAAQTAYAVSQPCSTCTTTCTQRVCNYVPQTAYRTAYVNTPVTTYRPFVSSDACSGCTTTCMRPVTSYVLRPTVVPYTSYRQVCQTVTSSPYTTNMPPAPALQSLSAGPYGAALPAVSYAVPSPSPYAANTAYSAASPYAGTSSWPYPSGGTALPYNPSYYQAAAAPEATYPQPTPYAPTGLIAPSAGCASCSSGLPGGVVMGDTSGYPSSPYSQSPSYTAPSYTDSGAGSTIMDDDAATTRPNLPPGATISPAPGSDAGLSAGANRPIVPEANKAAGENGAEDIRYRLQPQRPGLAPNSLGNPSRSGGPQDSIAWQRDGRPRRYTQTAQLKSSSPDAAQPREFSTQRTYAAPANRPSSHYPQGNTGARVSSDGWEASR